MRARSEATDFGVVVAALLLGGTSTLDWPAQRLSGPGRGRTGPRPGGRHVGVGGLDFTSPCDMAGSVFRGARATRGAEAIGEDEAQEGAYSVARRRSGESR
jgi:hypothetical protein